MEKYIPQFTTSARNGDMPLRQLSFIMKQVRSYAKKAGLKASFCYYKRWGVKKKHGRKAVIPLRFSKSGTTEIEKAYATHYVDVVRIGQLKEEKQRQVERPQTRWRTGRHTQIEQIRMNVLKEFAAMGASAYHDYI